MKKLNFEHIDKFTFYTYNKNMLLLLTLINVISSCVNMSQIFCDNGLSNQNNYYFDAKSTYDLIERCDIVRNVTKYLEYQKTHFRYSGIWSNNSCDDDNCYWWTYIIPPNTLIFSGESSYRVNYDVLHNLVVAYKNWDIASVYNVREREIIFGKYYENAKSGIYRCGLFEHVEPKTSSHSQYVNIIYITICVIVGFVVYFTLLSLCDHFRGNEHYTIDKQKYVDDVVTLCEQNESLIQLEPVYKHSPEITSSMYDCDQLQILLQPSYEKHDEQTLLQPVYENHYEQTLLQPAYENHHEQTLLQPAHENHHV